jgi:hypothetical protein
MYPQQWVLLEAVEAHDEGDRRIIKQMNVVGTYEDGSSAWTAYAELHREQPYVEFIPLHTSCEQIQIRIREEPILRGIRVGK